MLKYRFKTLLKFKSLSLNWSRRMFCAKYTEDEGNYYYTQGDIHGTPEIIVTDTEPTYGGSLIIVPTPIGNLKDLSIRQYEALTSCDIIAWEDTRKTGKLLELIKERRISELFRSKFGASVDDDHSTLRSDTTSKLYQDKEGSHLSSSNDNKNETYSTKLHDITGLKEKYIDDIEPKPWWNIENSNTESEESKLQIEDDAKLSIDQKEEGFISNQKRKKMEKAEVNEVRKFIIERIRFLDKSKEDDQTAIMIKRMEREIEMNVFENLNTIIENPKEFDEKLAQEVEMEFFKKVEDSEDYNRRKEMILQITDRLRKKVSAKVKEHLYKQSSRLDPYKEQTWKGLKASGIEQKLKEPYMGEEDHYSRSEQNFEHPDTDDKGKDSDDEFRYGIDGDFTDETKERIHKMRQKKGRGVLISLYEHNEEIRIPKLIRAMKYGMKIALVSDAGTPTISDPGYKLVNEWYKKGISIESLPGPSAVMVAASASGLVAERFIFEGYLSKTKGKRINTLKYLHSTNWAVVIFESPQRLSKTLADVLSVYGEEVEVYLGIELTKLHESNLRGPVKNVIESLEQRDFPLRGEVTVVISGKRITEDDLQKKSELGDMKREINIYDTIKNLASLGNYSDKELRKIMKTWFNWNSYEIEKVLDELRHKHKEKRLSMVKSIFQENKLPDRIQNKLHYVQLK